MERYDDGQLLINYTQTGREYDREKLIRKANKRVPLERLLSSFLNHLEDRSFSNK